MFLGGVLQVAVLTGGGAANGLSWETGGWRKLLFCPRLMFGGDYL